MTADSVLFAEEQRFRQPWLWGLMLVTVAPVPLVFGYGVYQQVIGGEPWGDRPMSSLALLVTTGLVTVLTSGLLILFWTARLVTMVEHDGLTVRFRPFHLAPRRIDPSDITAIEAVTYSPLLDYGGWGIRYGLRGKAYNVSGNRGVRLTMRAGKTLLIGSQRSEELAAALRLIRGRTSGTA